MGFTGAVPEVSDYSHGQVRGKKQIKNTLVDSGSDANVAIAHVILQCCPAHRTLRQGGLR